MYKTSQLATTIVSFILALIILSSCGNTKTDDTKSLNWMSKVSGIQLPDKIQNLDYYNNHEWGMIAKF